MDLANDAAARAHSADAKCGHAVRIRAGGAPRSAWGRARCPEADFKLFSRRRRIRATLVSEPTENVVLCLSRVGKVCGVAAATLWKAQLSESPGSAPRAGHALRDRSRRTITLLFDEQAARTPGAIALVFAEQELTYRQLDDTGHTPGTTYFKVLVLEPRLLVGVFVDRSVGMMVAILAILKAGGAYVPLDPAYPSERISLLLEDSRASVVLTTEALRERLPAVATRVVSLDGEGTASRIAFRIRSPALRRARTWRMSSIRRAPRASRRG